jgi:hypothetical protein
VKIIIIVLASLVLIGCAKQYKPFYLVGWVEQSSGYVINQKIYPKDQKELDEYKAMADNGEIGQISGPFKHINRFEIDSFNPMEEYGKR